MLPKTDINECRQITEDMDDPRVIALGNRLAETMDESALHRRIKAVEALERDDLEAAIFAHKCAIENELIANEERAKPAIGNAGNTFERGGVESRHAELPSSGGLVSANKELRENESGKCVAQEIARGGLLARRPSIRANGKAHGEETASRGSDRPSLLIFQQRTIL